MITWNSHGPAQVGSTQLKDGTHVKAVVVGPRHDPKGAVIVAPSTQPGKADTIVLADMLGALRPQDVIEILCMQERTFGTLRQETAESY